MRSHSSLGASKQQRPPPVVPRPQHTLSVYSTDIVKTSTAPSLSSPSGFNLHHRRLNNPCLKDAPKSSARKDAEADGNMTSVGVQKAIPPSTKELHAEEVTRRPTKNKGANDAEIVARLRAITNPEDPTKLYKNFIKIGQG